MSKKELFKFLINEFHNTDIAQINYRDLIVPKLNKVVTLIGPRRAGKTFYFYQLIKDLMEQKIPKDRIVYLDFEDDRILPLKLSDLNSLIEAYFELYPENKQKEIYLFFDEIQNIGGWELFVRRISDKEKVKVFVTGSSSKLLSKEIATALRGRTLTFHLFPLSFKEFLRFKGIELKKNFEYTSLRFNIKKLFEEYLYWGGFPEVVLEKSELKQKILSDYFELVIHKDLADRFAIRNITLMKNLSKFLITNLASIFSISAYHKAVSQDRPTAKKTIIQYLSNLEDVNFIYFVSLFDYSFKKQQANPKKVFCIDNGFRNAVAFVFSKDEGKLAENMAFIELKRSEKEIYYWKNKNEVDFVIKNRDNSLEVINVTYTNEVPEREIKGLLEFKEKFRKTKKLIILTKDLEKKEEGINFIPLWKWLLRN
ncbi:MAG: ATPase [Candidatus Diapherotrites archaeon CG08_land_8_20_14_0_20_34_12]|nr:MAG: ATPase [Candidatus Diapherotrites archaeon CG08_land_8_20_14_0_20_34_12]